MSYAYFPGCSLKGCGKAYEESLLAVFSELGLEMREIEDWNCCGATAFMSVDESMAYSLGGRNLALAEKQGDEVLAPCSACYLDLEKTRRVLEEDKEMGPRIRNSLQDIGLNYKGSLKIKHPIEVLVRDLGLEKIRAHVKKPLKGLKVVPYYGCQIVRPFASFDDQSNPTTMDQLLKTLGVKVLAYSGKTRCCGGSLTGTLPQAGLRLCYQLLREAKRHGADLVVTLCPLCQFNLDAFQDEIAREYENVSIPVVYFTQLMAQAFGLGPEATTLRRCIVPATELITKATREGNHES